MGEYGIRSAYPDGNLLVSGLFKRKAGATCLMDRSKQADRAMTAVNGVSTERNKSIKERLGELSSFIVKCTYRQVTYVTAALFAEA